MLEALIIQKIYSSAITCRLVKSFLVNATDHNSVTFVP